MVSAVNASTYVGPAILFGCSASFLTLTLLHVYLLTLGIRLNQFLTFWLPLMLAAFLILVAAVSSEKNWVLALIVGFAATMHAIIPLNYLAGPPVIGEDAIFGYQLVVRTLQTGSWQFGAGTGMARYIYSYFPMLFTFTASWASVASIPPYLITNYGIAAVNLTAFLTLRMLLGSIGLSKRMTNIALFLYALMPTMNSVESSFHYEAYAMVFFSLVLLYWLKTKITVSERIVALVSIIAIAFSHYYTAIILSVAAMIIVAAYLLFRGSRVHIDLLLLPPLAALLWNGNVAIQEFQIEIFIVQDVIGKLTGAGTYVTKILHGPATDPSWYPAPWFVQLALARNMIILSLSMLAILWLCVSLPLRNPFRLRIVRKDALTYLATLCLFAFGLSFVAYYGVAWGQTLLGSQGTGTGRYVEMTFIPFAMFGGAGLTLLLRKIGWTVRQKRRLLLGLVICALFVVVFVGSAVVQGYSRNLYDSSYSSIYYDEYSSTFQEPYYLGNWWNNAANHTFTSSQPFAGSHGLYAFVVSYGQQGWWEESLNSPYVELNSTFHAYYALDLAQLNKPESGQHRTLNPELISSGNPQLNAIFTTGRLAIISKPTATG